MNENGEIFNEIINRSILSLKLIKYKNDNKANSGRVTHISFNYI